MCFISHITFILTGYSKCKNMCPESIFAHETKKDTLKSVFYYYIASY